jgi:hypothetical protein
MQLVCMIRLLEMSKSRDAPVQHSGSNEVRYRWQNALLLYVPKGG